MFGSWLVHRRAARQHGLASARQHDSLRTQATIAARTRQQLRQVRHEVEVARECRRVPPAGVQATSAASACAGVGLTTRAAAASGIGRQPAASGSHRAARPRPCAAPTGAHDEAVAMRRDALRSTTSRAARRLTASPWRSDARAP
jgi:hypothetical protein